MKAHHYRAVVTWTGNEGVGTRDYRSYSRSHEIRAEGKGHAIMGSSDPSFSGDPSRYNPEELFLSSLSTCHMLWYLHLCSANDVTVTHYADEPEAVMEEGPDGSGRFTSVTLRPNVTVSSSDMVSTAHRLHEEANRMCFIANSCNFTVAHTPTTNVAG